MKRRIIEHRFWKNVLNNVRRFKYVKTRALAQSGCPVITKPNIHENILGSNKNKSTNATKDKIDNPEIKNRATFETVATTLPAVHLFRKINP